MIEPLLYFFLGIAVAGLVAMAIIPVVWRQAAKHAKRDIEATTPTNSTEVGAVQDLMRAKFAITICQLEFKVELLQQLANKYWSDLEYSKAQFGKLIGTLELDEAQADSLKANLSDFKLSDTSMVEQVKEMGNSHNHENKLVELETSIEKGQSEIAKLTESLTAERNKSEEFKKEATELAEMLRDSEVVRNSLEKQLKESGKKVGELEQILRETQDPSSSNPIEEQLVDADEKLQTLRSKFAQSEKELFEARNQLVEMQEQLQQSQMESHQAASSEMESTIRNLENELANMVADRDELKVANAALKAKAGTSVATSTETADLFSTREKLSEFAAQVAVLTVLLEGKNSEVTKILNNNSGSLNGGVPTLADKIRKLSETTRNVSDLGLDPSNVESSKQNDSASKSRIFGFGKDNH